MFRSAALTLALLPAITVCAQRPVPPIVAPLAAGHLVVLYRNGKIPAAAAELLTAAGGRALHHLNCCGISVFQTAPGEEAAVIARLVMRPEVAFVLRDRFVSAHTLLLPKAPQLVRQPLYTAPAPFSSAEQAQQTSPFLRPSAPPIFSQPGDVSADSFYNSPQGWAVRQTGGFGDNVPGGPANGPWTTSLGAGIRIAILDSGVDASHPDLSPNLAFNLSEIDSVAMPSPCDDASPQDQQGHGTWVASLALGALGQGTGKTVGVAPQATLLNIKVLQRMPAAVGETPSSQCTAGQPGGLLSWVLQGIADAVDQHAGIVSLSLGSIVDLTTGDGAGWQAAFNSVTYAATQSGTLIVASAGNDGLNLSGGQYIELPAQARGVLAVVASTNPACAEDLAPNATCRPGPVTRPYYSNYGATLNALAAPGGSYPEGPTSDPASSVSGFVMGACSNGLPNTTDGLPNLSSQSFGCFNLGHTAYVQAMGTSASAALVAGAAAVLRAARPNLGPAQIIAVLRSSATASATLSDPQLNLSAALAAQ